MTEDYGLGFLGIEGNFLGLEPIGEEIEVILESGNGVLCAD